MTKHTFIALSIPRPGREAEAEDWYDRQHIPDCLKPTVSSQLSAIGSMNSRWAPPFRHGKFS
jgi:hypothetical protein